MTDKILLADGLLEIDEEALTFCLQYEGEVYYHALTNGKGKRLLFELLSVNDKCKIIEVADEELEILLRSGDIHEAHIFYKKHGKTIALIIASGLAVLACGIAIGKALPKRCLSYERSDRTK